MYSGIYPSSRGKVMILSSKVVLKDNQMHVPDIASSINENVPMIPQSSVVEAQ